MSKARRLVPASMCVLALAVVAMLVAGSRPSAAAASNAVPMPAAPDVQATAFVLMDVDTGMVLASRAPDDRRPPASLTKIMTAFIVESEIASKRIGTQDQVPISEHAWRTEGSRMFVQVGTQVALSDLLRGVVIQSGNDASVALAEYVAGSESGFAEVMNRTAAKLGLTGTHFMNATGWPDPQHYSTARDLARLAAHVIRDYPEQYKVYSEREFTFNGIHQVNRNDLLFRDHTVDGMKTGYTEEAGYCLIASSLREGMRLLVVVLGAPDPAARARDSGKLLGFGFRYFQTHRLYQPGQVIRTSRVWGGAADSVDLGVATPVVVTLPRGRYPDLMPVAELQHVVRAPVASGAQLGMLRVKLDGTELVRTPLVARNAVGQGSWFKRLWHWILLFFTELFG